MITAWQAGDRLWIASRPRRGRFGPPQAVGSVADERAVALDVNARGDAVLAWAPKPSPTRRGTVVVSTRRGTAPFSSSVEVAREASGLDAGIADDGEVVIAVTIREGNETAADLMTGAVGQPAFARQRVEGLKGVDDLAVASDGSALVAGVTGLYADELMVVRRGPDGSLATLGPVGGRGPGRVASGLGAAGIVAWSEYARDQRGPPLQVRAVGPAGFGAIERLGFSDYQPALGRIGDGTAIAWRRRGDFMLAFVERGGSTAAPVVVDRASRGQSFEAGASPLLLPGRGDRATVVFERSNGARVSLIARDVRPGSVGPRLTLASDPSFVREAPSRACFPKGGKVIVRTSEVAVTDFGDETYVACLLKRGVPVAIEGEQGDSRVLGLPAVGGPLVAYAVVECGPLDCADLLVVEDLRSQVYGRRRVFNSSDTDVGLNRIAALRVSPRGDVAWIHCPGCDPPEAGRARVPSGSVAAVWTLAVTDAEPKLLENGRGIAPRSLEIAGTKVRWRRNGRQRSASLR